MNASNDKLLKCIVTYCTALKFCTYSTKTRSISHYHYMAYLLTYLFNWQQPTLVHVKHCLIFEGNQQKLLTEHYQH